MTKSTLPEGYSQLLDELKQAVRSARVRAHVAANTELLLLYWRIGRTILERQKSEGWGTGVISRLAADLRTEFPDMGGLSRRNLFYMRSFAAAVGDQIVQRAVLGTTGR